MKLFTMALAGLVFAQSAAADQLRYLPGAEGALAQYVDAIEKAESSIDITYYIWDPCSVVARVLVRALEKRKKERPNMPVRLLLDASLHSEKGRSEITATLAKRGIEARFYNYTKDVRKNVRTHVKFMVMDGKKVITGGRNIADDYFGLSSSMNWIDRDVYSEGPAARGAVNGFRNLWEDRLTKPEKRQASAAEVKDSEDKCLKADAKVLQVEAHLARRKEALLARMPLISCSNVTMAVDRADFMDGIGDGEGGQFLGGERLRRKAASYEILDVVGNAQKNLLFENYTYIPTGTFSSRLYDQRKENVSMTFVINDAMDEGQSIMKGPASHYQRAHDRGSQDIVPIPKGRFINDDWAMTPGKPSYQIHSKVLVSDDRNAVVSSWNLDPRSLHTNLESALVARDCPKFAAQVKGAIRDTYGPAMRAFANPELKYCLEERRRNGSKDGGFNKFLGWMVHEFL